MKEKVLRVDTFTNFNYSEIEFKQLEKISKDHPGYKVFVNSNSFVEIKGDIPAVVTINPHLVKFVKPKGNIGMIKACRIKYVSDPTDDVRQAFNESVEWCMANKKPILITYMRFRDEQTLKQYTRSHFNYIWAKNYFRQKIKKTWDLDCFNYCDKGELGCPSCMNCSKLTYGVDAEIYSINLSSSGMCKYNCPSCYVKTITQWHHGQICMDKIMQNCKQVGKKELTRYKYGAKQLTFDNFVKLKQKDEIKELADKYKIKGCKNEIHDVDFAQDDGHLGDCHAGH